MNDDELEQLKDNVKEIRQIIIGMLVAIIIITIYSVIQTVFLGYKFYV